jgi:hypothetical protein
VIHSCVITILSAQSVIISAAIQVIIVEHSKDGVFSIAADQLVLGLKA